MTVLVETSEFTIESLEMVPRGKFYVCPDCGGRKKLKRSKRCPSCGGKFAGKARAEQARKNRK